MRPADHPPKPPVGVDTHALRVGAGEQPRCGVSTSVQVFTLTLRALGRNQIHCPCEAVAVNKILELE